MHRTRFEVPEVLKFVAIAALSAGLVGTVLAFLVKQLVESTPGRMASDPSLMDFVKRASADFSAGHTVPLHELPKALEQCTSKAR